MQVIGLSHMLYLNIKKSFNVEHNTVSSIKKIQNKIRFIELNRNNLQYYTILYGCFL